MSVILLNAFVQVWVNIITCKVPQASPRAYADDLAATAPTVRILRRVLSLTQKFAQATGMRLNVKKCWVWGFSPRCRLELGRCFINGQKVPLVTEERYLGAYLSFGRKRRRTRIDHKASACKAVCERIEMLGLPLEARAVLAATAVVPKALYACAATPPSRKALQGLRSRVARAVWGQGNRWRAPEVLFTILCKGHLVDPVQAFGYQTLLTHHRVLGRHPHLRALFNDIMTQRQTNLRPHIGGPVKALLDAYKLGNMEPNGTDGGFHYVSGDGDLMEDHLIDSDVFRISHVFRECLRREQWDRLDLRRPGFSGINGDVDRKATQWFGGRLRGLQRYRWRCILTGAIPTAHRLYRMGVLDGNACPCCGQAAETLTHIVDSCPALDAIRYQTFRPPGWHSLPECLRLHGIMPETLFLAADYSNDAEGRKECAADVQETLLKLMETREAALGLPTPQPRWAPARNS